MKQKTVLLVFLCALCVFAVSHAPGLRADSFRHEENIRKNARALQLNRDFADADALVAWADAEIDAAKSLPDLKAAQKRIHRKLFTELALARTP